MRWMMAAVLALSSLGAQAARLQPDLSGLDAVPLHVVPALVTRKAVEQAQVLKGTGPYIFAATVALVVPLTGGAWDRPDPGTARWRTRIFSAQAKALALEITSLHMPRGGELWIYDADGKRVQGPYTRANQNAEKLMWTALVPGEIAVLDARMPAARRGEFALELAHVGHAFRDPYSAAKVGLGDSGSCNFDVVCPVGDDWSSESRSVARLQIPVPGGLGFCSGTLVNNVQQDNRNFILTADHCEIGRAGSPAAGVVVYWNFQNSVCRGADDASEADAQSGTLLRANDQRTDLTLLELVTAPDPAFNVFYAGWDASGAGATSATGIHHPQGDAKKISTTSVSLVPQFFGFSSFEPATIPAWKVTRWGVGTTEPGSSGSSLWNQDHRIVGALSGGEAACASASDDNNLPDFYARMHCQWEANSAASGQLKAWLDPANTGVRCITGRNPSGSSTVCAPATATPASCFVPTATQQVTSPGGGALPAAALGLLLLSSLLRRRRESP
ncbi:MAG TPA: trypsin-like peptidase domain-containing protein [Solimonas sp.]|nr:trypsin-like peptidase domain-containing protein [Solimonas sp.]